VSLDLAAITQNALGAASKAGVTASCVITRPAPPPNPLTGTQSGSATTQTVRAVPTDARRLLRASDAAWAQSRVSLFVAFNDVTFTPQVGDTATFNGATMRVTVVDTYAPAGAPIAFLLGLG
jgi:hypothetical protein